MSFYNTGNPVPSVDPRDLDDNAKHIDEIANSTLPTFVDRLGATRKTLAGIESDADAILLRSDLANAISAAKGSSLVGRGVQVVNSVAELRLLSKVSPAKTAFTLGHAYPGDGGDGWYRYDSSDTTSADNNGSIIQCADGARRKLVTDSAYNVRQFGATGDGATDDTVSIQKCITAAMTDRKSVFLPAGNYKTISSLLIDNTASTTYIDPKKIDFYGDGIHLSRIIFTGVTGSCLSVIGGQSAGTLPSQCFQELRNFGVIGTVASGTIGILLDTTQHIKLSNVEVNSFDYGLKLLDVDFASFHKVIIHWNNHGIYGEERFPRLVNSTRPNGIDFVGCQIGGNGIFGAQFIGGACINFYGGDVEGNGLSNGSSGWGLRFESCGVQGGVGANLNGVYFEQNQGIADVWIVAIAAPGAGLNPYHCVHSIQSCSFNRVTSANFTTNNIVASIDSANAGKQRVAMRDCSFKGYGTYVASGSRLYVSYPVNPRNSYNSLIEGCIMQDDVESVPQNDKYNVSLGLSAAQSVATATSTDILWTSENYDSDSMHIASAATITILATGKYLISGAIYWAANATGVRTMQIIKNGSLDIAGDTRNASASGRTRHSTSLEFLLVKGDTIGMKGFQDSGGSLNADADGCRLSVRMLPY